MGMKKEMFFWSFCIHSSTPLRLDEWILIEEQMMDGNNSRVLWLTKQIFQLNGETEGRI